MPKNAAIAVIGIIVSAASLALAFLIPWGNEVNDAAPAPAAPVAATTSGKGPSPLQIVRAPAGGHGPPEATRISLDIDNVSPAEAASAFGSVSSLQAYMISMTSASRASLAPVSLHLKEAPLLEGMFQLSRATGTVPEEITGSHIYFRAVPDATFGRWVVLGPVGVVAQKIESTTALDAAGPALTNVTLTLNTYAEPALRSVSFSPLIIDEFVDDKGQKIATRAVPQPPYSMQRSPFSRQSTFTLTLPPSPGEKIAILRGKTVVTVASRMQLLQTAGPEETLSETVADFDVQVSPLRKAGGSAGNVTFTLTFRRGEVDRAQWARFAGLLNSLEPVVFSAGNQRMNTSVPQYPASSADTLVRTVYCYFDPAQGEPHHIQVHVPSELHDISVPFDFKNLILP